MTARPTTVRTVFSGSTRVLRAVFVVRDSSVAILIEHLQGLAGLSDFVGVNRAVVIQIEGQEDGIDRVRTPGAPRPARSTVFTIRPAGPTPLTGRPSPFALRSTRTAPVTTRPTMPAAVALPASGPTTATLLGVRPAKPTAVTAFPSRAPLTVSLSRSTRAVGSAGALRT